MKCYLITTGTVFALIAVAHVWRVTLEGSRLATDPWFVLTTCLAVGLSVWAFWLLKRTSHR
jgi:hypothetical protein